MTGSRGEVDRRDRVGELLREVLGEHLERLDDSRLRDVVVTGVDVDIELSRAVVWIDSSDPDAAVHALGRARSRLQRAVGREARLRRTPALVFRPDLAIDHGERIESILHGLRGDEGPNRAGPAPADPEPPDPDGGP